MVRHRHELAQQAVGESGRGGRTDRREDDQERPAGALGDRHTLYPSYLLLLQIIPETGEDAVQALSHPVAHTPTPLAQSSPDSTVRQLDVRSATHYAQSY